MDREPEVKMEESYACRTRTNESGGERKTYISLHCYVLTVLYDLEVGQRRKIHL